MSKTVLMQISEGIALFTLNRPEKLNALNYELIDWLMVLLDTIEVNDAVGAVIITGAGDRAFSAGGDINEFSESVAAGVNPAVRDFVRRGQLLTARLEAFPKPVIAAVNGIALGGGCEITEAVHLAIASDRARFAKPEIKLGMPPTFGGTQRLPRLAGRKRALELLLTGEDFSPERARDIGLVNHVVAHEELMPAARDLASRIMGYPRLPSARSSPPSPAASTCRSQRGCWWKANSSPRWCRPTISPIALAAWKRRHVHDDPPRDGSFSRHY